MSLTDFPVSCWEYHFVVDLCHTVNPFEELLVCDMEVCSMVLFLIRVSNAVKGYDYTNNFLHQYLEVMCSIFP
jgi:hypothetical protein